MPVIYDRVASPHHPADQVDTVNSFDAPSAVAPKAVRFQASGGTLVVKLPPRSVTVVRLEP